MKPESYTHFHPDEHPFIDQVNDWLDRVEDRHQERLTDFLDPRQQFIVESFANTRSNVRVAFGGGYDQAERKRAWIAPDYRSEHEADFNIELLEVSSSDSRYTSLEHGDFLGALTGLGIKRDKVGDIHVHPNMCHAIISKEIIQYVDLQLHQVHKVSVVTDILPLDRLQVMQVELEEQLVLVASLRLDAVLSELTRVSRAKVLPTIRAGQCRVNWKVEENPACLLQQGDMLSIRGHGRFQILSLEGATRKGNQRVKIGKIV